MCVSSIISNISRSTINEQSILNYNNIHDVMLLWNTRRIHIKIRKISRWDILPSEYARSIQRILF